MLRSLVLSAKPAYPPAGGAALRNWQTINGLARLGAVTAVSTSPGAAASAEFSDRIRLQSFAMPKSLTIVRDALSHAPGPIARRRDDLLWLARRTQLERLRSEFKPDLVVLAELAWVPLIDHIRRWQIPIIYDAHNVEAKRFREMPDAGLPYGKWRARNAGEAERAATSAATQIWTCSELDRDEMATAYGRGERINVIPNGIHSTSYDQLLPEPEVLQGSPCKLLYAGDFAYSPNAVAAERICSRLFPELRRQMNDVTVCLAGSNPTKSMLDYAARDPSIIVTGRVDDIRSYFMHSDCLLVPLESGGGTRLKILEAFAAGCPVVSTHKGAEGLAGEAGIHLLVGDTDAELVQRTVEICTRPELAATLKANALGLVAAKYDWSIVHAEIARAVASLSGSTAEANSVRASS